MFNTIYNLSKTAFFVFVALALIAGWMFRDESYLTAETGLGYYLGITGGLLMLLLLLYPMRKKSRFMRNWGPVKHWFKAHMIMGILGPVLVLFHANFSLGSPNSTLALISMSIVAASGLIGRFFYTRIHYGLYGRHANLQELKDHLNITKGKLGEKLRLGEALTRTLEKYEDICLRERGILVSILRLPVVMLLSRVTYFRVVGHTNRLLKRYVEKKNLPRSAYRKLKKQAKGLIKVYVHNVKQISGFSAYVKLFSIWHYLHYPLFLMLVITGILHVVVVHLY
ncbi:MAG: hypothetical protein OEZ39_10630 [Gammaproteobacteria bacterium]|nr:hypothetical protein [Gammaproteobacteria bacterium]MDH5652298.1 hypothetical protein [Gammaproteobacteria bacterium]